MAQEKNAAFLLCPTQSTGGAGCCAPPLLRTEELGLGWLVIVSDYVGAEAVVGITEPDAELIREQLIKLSDPLSDVRGWLVMGIPKHMQPFTDG